MTGPTKVERWFPELLVMVFKSWVWAGHLGMSVQQGRGGGPTQAMEGPPLRWGAVRREAQA